MSLSISSVSPSSISQAGGNINLVGTGFNNVATNGNVQFQLAGQTSIYGSKVASDDNHLVIAPFSAFPVAGTWDIHLFDGSTSADASLIVTAVAAPVISSLSETSGSIGTPLTVYGSNFASNSSVTINGIPATVTQVSGDGTSLICIIPAGTVATSGNVIVTSNGVASNSYSSFTFLAATIQLTQIDPTFGGSGQSFRLEGSGFGSVLSNIQVLFGTIAASLSNVDGSGATIYGSVPSGLSAGTVNVSVIVSGSTSSNTLPFTFQTQATAQNNQPTGPSLPSASTVTLSGGVSSTTLSETVTPGTSSSLTYLWTQVAGTAASITSPNSASTGVTGLNSGTSIFQLEVIDSNGLSATTTITVNVGTITIVNPTNNPGSTQTLASGVSSATLSGTASPGGSSSIQSNTWTQVSGPNTATFTNANTLTATASGLITGTYVFKLTTIDLDGGQVSNNVTIVASIPVTVVNPQIGLASALNLSVGTTSATLTPTITPGTSTSISYSWTKISGSGTITSPTSLSTQITGLATGLDVFQLTATASDGGSAINQISILVTAVQSVSLKSVAYINFTSPQSLAAAPWNNITANNNTNFVILNDGNGNPFGNLNLTNASSFIFENDNIGVTSGNDSNVYPDIVCKDGWGVAGNGGRGTIQITGLSTSNTYDFTFFNSWYNAFANAKTLFYCGNSFVSINPANNKQNTATLTQLTPDSSGTISIEVRSDSNTVFGLINAMVITKH